jgi:hypothetical protein
MNTAISGDNAQSVLFLIVQKLIVSRAERKVYPAYPSASSENERRSLPFAEGIGHAQGGGLE